MAESIDVLPSCCKAVCLTEILLNSHVERQDVDWCETCATLRDKCHDVSRKAKVEKLLSATLCEELRSDRSLKHNIRDSVEEGWVHPSLEVVELSDHTHPIRLATPVNERAFCLRWRLDAPPVESNDVS